MGTPRRPRSRPRRLRGDAGLTLLEVLVASSLTALVSLASAMALQVGLRGTERTVDLTRLTRTGALSVALPGDVHRADAVATDGPRCRADHVALTLVSLTTTGAAGAWSAVDYGVQTTAGGTAELVRTACRGTGAEGEQPPAGEVTAVVRDLRGMPGEVAGIGHEPGSGVVALWVADAGAAEADRATATASTRVDPPAAAEEPAVPEEPEAPAAPEGEPATETTPEGAP